MGVIRLKEITERKDEKVSVQHEIFIYTYSKPLLLFWNEDGRPDF